MTGGRPVIRTPDQRIRVFVSSTLRELAAERRAARRGIEKLHLAPVMFELGARPHPPRDLYRAYLEQSDIFIAIYADSYGWVAPEESVSGLEDEYNLAPREMPKLIYIRASETRDERLKTLISRIQADDTAAYLPFEDADELESRVFDDLATLLAERFEQSRDAEIEVEPQAPALAASIPVPYTTTIGRDDAVAAVRELLATGRHRLVSLIGPGGIGKSRLAIETALATKDVFPDGTYFVLLEGVHEESLLLPTLAYSLGIRDNGEASLRERIAHALAGRRVLVVLDNFEQIVDSAPIIVELFALAPTATFLVTSRIVLRIRGERVFEVPALSTTPGTQPANLDRSRRSAAVRLFIDRAQAVKPEFDLTPENAQDVADICRTLEGLPLAIELAAAKMRVLTPKAIAQRLTASLPLLSAGVRDLPERHRTMRATIEWSVGLLSAQHRAMLEDLGVFATRFTLEAVEAIGRGRVWDGAALDGIGALVDQSLVKQTEIDGRPVLSLLSVVREYAVGRLKESGDAGRMRAAHADYYTELVASLAPGLRGTQQADAVATLGLELANLRAAVRHLIYTDRLDDAGDFAWCLLIYWWIAGFFGEVRVWMLELLDKQHPITPHTRAVAWFFSLWGEMWQRPSQEVVAGLGEVIRLFAESGDEDASAMVLAARATARVQFPRPDLDRAQSELEEAVGKLRMLGNGWGEAITEVSLGRLAWLRGRTDEAVGHFQRALEVAEAGRDLFTQSVAGNQVARLQLQREEWDGAAERFVRGLLLSIRLHHDEGIAFGLEGMCAVAAGRGDAWRAGALSAAAAAIRRRIGMWDVEQFLVHSGLLEKLRAEKAEAMAAGEDAGREMSVPEAVALALPEEHSERVRDALRHW